jgi:cell division protease FtsH
MLLFFAALLAFDYVVSSTMLATPSTHPRIPYSPMFLGQVRAGNVNGLSSTGTSLQGTFKRPVRYQARRITGFSTEVPAYAGGTELFALLARHGVVMEAQPVSTGTPWWVSLLYLFAPALLIIALMVFVMRRASGAGGVLSFGRSRARRFQPSGEQPSFADVAGIDEAKDELAEVVDFLQAPEKYVRLGGRIPHGVLLVGPPGTGKTLLARAVAGEAGVPFFSMSAAEFIEMFVGVGASRVRDLFSQAKQSAPAIIFIDELDAIGRTRGAGWAGMGGGHDEREQTLNQILTEMDGFDPSSGVIVLSATNRPDVLDPALLRPGRFDRRIAVQPPDRAGREAILRVHTRHLPLAADVDLRRLAATAAGMVGADLANLANEAALLAAHRNHDTVQMDDFSDALEKIVLGTERKIVLSPVERERTAYHEAGHAIVGMLTPGADPVRKVSIVPRGISLGATFAAPEAEQLNYTRHDLLTRIHVALGGRAAEELVFQDISTGAESDIVQITETARRMVSRWGMSSVIGPIAVAPSDAEVALWPGPATASPHTQELIDAEVHRIVEEAHREVAELLSRHRPQLDALAHALLEHETLDQPAAYAAAGIALPSAGGPPAVQPVDGSIAGNGAPKESGGAGVGRSDRQVDQRGLGERNGRS